LLFLVAFILLFYFVSQNYIKELNCTVKQISVCCIHGLTVDVLMLLWPRKFKKNYLNFGSKREKVIPQSECPESSAVSVCTATVTVHINCTIGCIAAGVTTF
jgi:hypothetical protein